MMHTRSRAGHWLRQGWLAGLLAAIAFGGDAAGAGPPVRKVLFIGIDGCRFDAIEAAETPALDALRADGCFDRDCQILGDRYRENDTISGPGWSSILTGVWADKHGVHDNSFQGKRYGEYPHLFARIKEVRPEAYTASVVTWVPIHLHIVSQADYGVFFPPKLNDYVEADALAAQAAAKVLREEDPTVVFLYIGQVDETGHAHGFHPTVPEYIAAIEQADRHIGEVVGALRERPTYGAEDWLIVVTSDHGGRGTGHGGGHDVPEIRNSFLIVSGPAAVRGELDETTHLVDASATVIAHLGIAPKSEWGLDGRPVGLAAPAAGQEAPNPPGGETSSPSPQ